MRAGRGKAVHYVHTTSRGVRTKTSVMGITSVTKIGKYNKTTCMTSGTTVMKIAGRATLHFRTAKVHYGTVYPKGVVAPVASKAGPTTLSPSVVNTVSARDGLEAPSYATRSMTGMVLFFTDSRSGTVAKRTVMASFKTVLWKGWSDGCLGEARELAGQGLSILFYVWVGGRYYGAGRGDMCWGGGTIVL